MKIGFFDSGIGGLSILRETYQLLPDDDYFYIADNLYNPYGNLSEDEIRERSKLIVQRLLDWGAKIIVVACNSATAVSVNELRSTFACEIVGVEPYVNSINHQINNGKRNESNEEWGVILTEATANSKKFKSLMNNVDPQQKIKIFPNKDLARLIDEDQWTDDLLEKELMGLRNANLSHLILGCTHYPLIKDKIKEILNVEVISPCQAVAHRVEHFKRKKSHSDGKEEIENKEIYFSMTKKDQNYKNILLKKMPGVNIVWDE